MLSNYELRQKARAALKGNWQTALVVMFIASLPGLISQVVDLLQGSDLYDLFLSQVQTGHISSLMDPQYLAGLAQAQLGTAYLARNLLSLLAALVTPFLTLGMLRFTLRLLRGENPFITDVFSRAGLFFRALGLEIVTALKVALWALPGAALMAGSLLLAGADASETAANIAAVLLGASYILLVALVVTALYRYAMAQTVLADHPEYGIRQSIGESKKIMKGRKAMLFLLQMSFLGWLLLLGLMDWALEITLGSVIASTVYMLLNLALQVYLQTAECAFYEANRAQENDPVPAEGHVDA